MKISDAGVEMIKTFEGCRLTAYQDSGGVWTIGFGHAQGVSPGETITEVQADFLLRNDLRRAEWSVMKHVLCSMTQGQFDALTSFTFNVGEGALEHSTLLRKLNAGDVQGAADEFLRWVHDAKGNVLPGLVARRQKERALFLSPEKETA